MWTNVNTEEIATLEQGSPEWLEFRKLRIGSSDIPVIMGMSPYRTPLDLYKEKIDGIKKQENEFILDQGHYFEGKARAAVELETHLTFWPITMVHPKNTDFMASFDGWNEDKKIFIECKLNGEEAHSMAKKGLVRNDHLYQMQWQYLISNAESAYYVSLKKNSEDIAIVKVERKMSLSTEIIEKAEWFLNLMKTKTPPPLSDKDVLEVEDGKILGLLTEYRAIKQNIQTLELREKDLRAEIQHNMPHSRIHGSGVSVVKYKQKGAINYKDIPELKGIGLDKYREPSKTIVKFILDGDTPV